MRYIIPINFRYLDLDLEFLLLFYFVRLYTVHCDHLESDLGTSDSREALCLGSPLRRI